MCVVVVLAETAPRLLRQLHHEASKFLPIIGGAVDGEVVAEALAAVAHSVHLPAAETLVPAVAFDALERLLVQELDGSTEEVEGREYATDVESCLEAVVDATEIS